MKPLVKIAFLIIVTTIFSCKKGKSDLSGTYQLRDAVPVNMTIERKTWIVTASNINDSRCPQNSKCFWEGFATAELTLRFSDLETKTFKLCTGGCNVVKLAEKEVLTLNGVDHQVQLKDVTVSRTSNKKIAIIKLVKI